ncbi:MAG: tetratricopeptide repeat protein [Bacteroidales bacterium]
MKRTAFLLIIGLLAASFAQAQTRDVRRASRQLNRGNLIEAKEYMDAAMQDESALSDPETWVVKAQLYMEIFTAEDPAVKQLAETPLDEAHQALQKAQELDDDNQQIIEIQQSLLVLSELLFNAGVEYYTAERFELASDNFLRSYDLAESFGSIDTTTLYNAALALELNRDFEEAVEQYRELVELEYDQPYIYSSLANISLELGDTTESVKYITMGRERYPDDLNLIFSEANIHIFSGDVQKAREVLDLAISKDPNNPNLYFAFGANYDKMAQDTTYSAEEREFAYEEAIKAYNKAIEIDPDYFDAIYNLGVLYFNEGIRIFEEADQELRASHDFKAYEKAEERFQEMWLKAQPYLEQAKDMLAEDDPNLEIVVVSLTQLYMRTNQTDKYQEIKTLYPQYFEEVEEIEE